MVNNLGGTSNLELSIMTNATIRYLGTCMQNNKGKRVLFLSSAMLVDVMQVVVVRVYTGSLMTSLEMAGVSLTLLKLSPDWLPYLGIHITIQAILPTSKTSTPRRSNLFLIHFMQTPRQLLQGGQRALWGWMEVGLEETQPLCLVRVTHLPPVVMSGAWRLPLILVRGECCQALEGKRECSPVTSIVVSLKDL